MTSTITSTVATDRQISRSAFRQSLYGLAGFFVLAQAATYADWGTTRGSVFVTIFGWALLMFFSINARNLVGSKNDGSIKDSASAALASFVRIFSLVLLIVAMVAVFFTGLGSFIGGLASGDAVQGTVLQQLLTIYLPIILSAGTVVYGVWRGLVFTKRSGEEDE